MADFQGYILPTGWEVFTTSDEIWDIDGSNSKDGFYAIAYVNHNYQVKFLQAILFIYLCRIM
jgi:hypothetical protein